MTAMLRLLVCGGRDFGHKPDERDFIFRELHKIFPETEPDQFGNTLPIGHVISGGQRGVDTVAIDYAVIHFMTFSEFKITPREWREQGAAAGPRRNRRMIKEGRPDAVVAFPGGSGTCDMISQAREAGLPVSVIAKPTEEWERASGLCVCPTCGKLYFDHPAALEQEWTGLRRLCNGKLVKL